MPKVRQHEKVLSGRSGAQRLRAQFHDQDSDRRRGGSPGSTCVETPGARPPRSALPTLTDPGPKIFLKVRNHSSARRRGQPGRPEPAAAQTRRRGALPFGSRRRGGPPSRNGITDRILPTAMCAGPKLAMHQLRKGSGCRVAKRIGKGGAARRHERRRARRHLGGSRSLTSWTNSCSSCSFRSETAHQVVPPCTQWTR